MRRREPGPVERNKLLAFDLPVAGTDLPLQLLLQPVYTDAKQTDEGLGAAASAGFRALISPSVSLGSHWFLYSAFDIQ